MLIKFLVYNFQLKRLILCINLMVFKYLIIIIITVIITIIKAIYKNIIHYYHFFLLVFLKYLKMYRV